MSKLDKIRNFSIIAHIDHGKSTLADRMIEITNTVQARKMKDQILDGMDIERERGITIKLKPVSMEYKGYNLNLIDTPGHVDFSYEVSRSLAAVETALLLVDATQGIQAQTLANLYLALEQDLQIIPVINKIDLPAANPTKVKAEIVKLLGCDQSEIHLASGKTGAGVEEILEAVIEKGPSPKEPKLDSNDISSRSLIFDSIYDNYQGVLAYIRVVNGKLEKGDKIKLASASEDSEVLDCGIFSPEHVSTGKLEAGQIGYVVTGFKDVSDCQVGDTIFSTQTNIATADLPRLPGYKEVKPMVFAGIFPKEGGDFKDLREAMEKLKLNDAALSFEPERSDALGFGFRCGFLGLLHLEVFQERLRREYNLDLIITIPSVAYRVYNNNGESEIIRTPQRFPDQNVIKHKEEPWVNLDIIVPKEYMGNVMNLAQEKRGIYKNTEYISGEDDSARAVLHYEMPLASILTDFYDKIKSVSSGFASINYEYLDYREADVVKLDILVAEEAIEALATIVYRDDAFRQGKAIVKILKESLPRQLFAVKIQAAIGAKIIAAEKLPALRKDVTAKLYGGDVSRKRKLLEKQKRGKKKMMQAGKGSVDIPADAFVKILKR